jgi:prephenate dehydrogenase
MSVSWHIKRLAIAGVGLIGGSLAAALKQAGLVDEIIGLGRRRETLESAKNLGLIDRIAENPEDIANADMVVLAMPVAQTESVLKQIRPYLSDVAVVTDAGSTKGDVIDAARRILGDKFHRFVPGHPIAGSENHGPQAARANLYRGRNVVLCPIAETLPDAVARVTGMWEAAGARVANMDAARHDRIFAAVSHLPHLAAFALVDDLANRADADTYFAYAASGFRDFTRIAGSSPEMWRDIALANRQALLVELRAYRNKLDEIAQALETGDAAALETIFGRASAARRNWGIT